MSHVISCHDRIISEKAPAGWIVVSAGQKVETWKRFGYESYGYWAWLRAVAHEGETHRKKSVTTSTARSKVAPAADQRPGRDRIGQQHSHFQPAGWKPAWANALHHYG